MYVATKKLLSEPGTCNIPGTGGLHSVGHPALWSGQSASKNLLSIEIVVIIKVIVGIIKVIVP